MMLNGIKVCGLRCACVQCENERWSLTRSLTKLACLEAKIPVPTTVRYFARAQMSAVAQWFDYFQPHRSARRYRFAGLATNHRTDHYSWSSGFTLAGRVPIPDGRCCVNALFVQPLNSASVQGQVGPAWVSVQQ